MNKVVMDITDGGKQYLKVLDKFYKFWLIHLELVDVMNNQI